MIFPYQIITSLLDMDLYKLTMMQVALFRYPAAVVEHEFKCRNEDVDLTLHIDEIKEQIELLGTLRFKDDELRYLHNELRYIKPEFIPFLRMFQFDISQIKISVEKNGLSIKTKGPWWQTILYEIFVLSIVNEVHFYHKMNALSFADQAKHRQMGVDRLMSKINLIKDVNGFKFIEFGTRRRFSKEWQREALSLMVNNLPKNMIVGTSNILLAKDFGLKPIGTMAHEYLQAFQGLGICPLVKSQETALDVWSDYYEGDLGIALTDVINMDSFLKSFNRKHVKLFDGLRHDSGDPIVWGEKAIDHYQKFNVSPMTKTLCFSNGLDFPEALRIFEYFKGRIDTSYGIGTNITNDLGFKALNIVMKMVLCNGNNVAKISDDVGKGLCLDEEYLSYLLKVHNEKPSLFEKPAYY